MNDLTALQFLASLPLVFFGVGAVGVVAWLIIQVRRALRKGGDIF